MTDAFPCHGYDNSLLLNLPPLAHGGVEAVKAALST